MRKIIFPYLLLLSDLFVVMDRLVSTLKSPLLLNTPDPKKWREKLQRWSELDNAPMSPVTGKPYSRDCYLKMMIIGIGYLFPMCALFAAFDYWKELFADRATSIEFEIMVVYQTASVGTVFALSLVESMDMHLRIVGGFIGQFISLLFIATFPLLSEFIPATVLYYVLMVFTFSMAVSTGFLDSALLCFNSQYSPRMQEALQIGIGCSIFASVVYRDVTKMIGSNIEESSIIYFVCSLLTVIACLWNYISLLRHPVSWPVRASPVFRGEQRNGDDTPASLALTPNAEDDQISHFGSEPITTSKVIQKCWKNQLVVFLHFIYCSLGYPAMITAIPLYSASLREDSFLGRENWYQAMLLTIFTVTDTASRFAVRERFSFTPSSFWKSVIIRTVLIPLLWVAAGGWVQSDLFSVMAVVVFGLTNGYCISLSLILMNEIPGMNVQELAVAGRFSAFSVNAGLCVGGILASLFSSVFIIQP
jgi:equilibrative nucleoside transporter 1/2/3